MSHIEHDEDCEHGDDAGAGTYPFSAWGTVFEVLQFASVVAASVSTFLGRIAMDAAAHNNHAVQKRKEAESQRSILDDIAALERGERP